MRVPTITHLQAAVLAALAEKEASIKELRAALERYGQKLSVGAIYQLAAQMEGEALIVGEFRQASGEKPGRERFYRASPKGCASLREALHFYKKVEAILHGCP